MICDRPDRIGTRLAAWLFERLRVECGCCTFYRVAALGGAIGALIGAAATAVAFHFT